MTETFATPASQLAADVQMQQFRDTLGPFVAAAETTRMAIVFTDASGAGDPVVFANDSFLALTGFNRDAILRQDLLFLLGGVADRGTLSAIVDALRSGADGTWELQCRRADGSEFLAAVYLSPVRNAEGAITQNFVSFVELGGHIDRILKQRDEFHALYEQAPGFIAVSDGPTHIFTFANASYRRLVGRENLVGLTVAQALPEIVDQGFIAHLDRVYDTGEPFLGSNMPICLDAGGDKEALRFVNFVYQPVRDGRNRITGVFCEGYDVTAAREAADNLAAMQAELIHLSRANAMGAMATTLAHELNQPLAAISSYVAGCRRILDPNSGNAGQLRDALIATEEASQRAGDIIRHVRDLMRRGEPTKSAFALAPAVSECVRLVMAGRSDEVDVQDLTPNDMNVHADRVQIQQVVINLLRNACDAVSTTDRKQVIVNARILNGCVVVSVTDSGAGVSAAAARSIFSWSDSSKEGGMGLGLSISRTIIEEHRGRIWLDRSDGSGSAFCFSLPSVEASRDTLPAA